MSKMKSLTWNQVNAWRLAQHGLAPRLPHGEFVEGAVRTCGIQAQVMSAAALALWARTDGLTQEDVQSALWEDHTLVKTWAMRGTLHQLAAEDLPLYVAARQVHDPRNWVAFFEYYGVPKKQMEAFFEAVPQVLGSEPMTREELAIGVGEHVGSAKLRELVGAPGWGTALKPSAWRGDLCFGPNQGRNVTFVNPSKWIEKWEEVNPEAAFQEVVRRFLRAYGPDNPVNFSRWWDGGGGITAAKKVFKSISDELEEVDVEGWEAFALRSTLEPMQHFETSGVIRLLPLFDAYPLGIGRDVEALLPRKHIRKVFRPQGWISAVVLVDGYMKGVWDYKTKGKQMVVKVEMFESATKQVRKGVEAEAERLGEFLGSKVVVEYNM